MGGPWDGREASYQQLLKDIAGDKEKSTPGAIFQPKRYLADFLREKLQPVDIVLDFRENGAMILGEFQEGARQPRTALCIIGGVKDIHEEETRVLIQAGALGLGFSV